MGRFEQFRALPFHPSSASPVSTARKIEIRRCFQGQTPCPDNPAGYPFTRAEEALRKLRPQVEAILIDNAEAELRVVRVDPASSQAWNSLKISIGKIVERLAINAVNEGTHEAIHQLIKILF